MIDYTRLLRKLDPPRDGEDPLRFRKGIIDAVNSNGTVDVGISGVVIPGIQVLAGATVAAGAQVWVHTWGGALYVLGRAATSAAEVTGPMTRIETTIHTTNSGNITTTETTVASVTAALVQGRTYKVTYDGAVDTSLAGDTCDGRLRLTNSSGTEMQLRRTHCLDAAGRWPVRLEAEYTPASTGNFTFVATYVRGSGGGNLIRIASATIPTFLYVDYVRN